MSPDSPALHIRLLKLKDKLSGGLGWLVVGLLTLFVAAIVGFFGGMVVGQGIGFWRMATWTGETTGTVESTFVTHGRKGSSATHVTYAYEVEGKRHTGTAIGPEWSWFDGAETRGDALAVEFPKGRSVTVHFNPADPSQAFLWPKVRKILLAIPCSLLPAPAGHPLRARLELETHDAAQDRSRLRHHRPWRLRPRPLVHRARVHRTMDRRPRAGRRPPGRCGLRRVERRAADARRGRKAEDLPRTQGLMPFPRPFSGSWSLARTHPGATSASPRRSPWARIRAAAPLVSPRPPPIIAQMKYLPIVAGILLGALFLMASGMFFLGMGPKEPPPMAPAAEHFMAAAGPTGFMAFVKVFELVGGVTVMIPRLRNLGLLLLTPVIVNIVAFHFLIAGDPEILVTDPMHIAVWVLPLYLLWVARRNLAALLKP